MSSEDAVDLEPPVASTSADASSDADESPAELRARVELLAEENRRLREEYARARQSQHRRTAYGLGGLGVVALLGGLLFPASRTVLFALGGTGVFLAVLTVYLAPETFLPASLGRTVYAALARNEAAVVAELGLSERRVYVPTGPDDVRLFVPQHDDYAIPDDAALSSSFVVTDDPETRGLALDPTGDGLAAEFERAVTGDGGSDPSTLAAQVADALVEQFELVDSATPDVDPNGGRVTLAVDDSAYGALDRFDHPVASVLACVAARRLDRSVELAVEETVEAASDYRVTVTWDEVGDQ